MRLMMTALVMCALAVGGAQAGSLHGGVNVGTSAGLGVQVSGAALDFTRDVPLSARLSFGFHAAEPGDPYAARRVFINDATNGDPEKSAKSMQLRFDLMVPALHVGPQQLYVFGGPRHSRYTANYNYIGGNENFDVVSNPWGLGGGLESWFTVSDRAVFVLQVGLDWYAKTRLEGHDTAYLPGGDDVNPRNDYTWSDADDAVGQPRLELLSTMGLRFRL